VKFSSLCADGPPCTAKEEFASPQIALSTSEQLVVLPPPFTFSGSAVDVNISYAVEGQHYTDIAGIQAQGGYFGEFSVWWAEPYLGPVDGNTLVTVKGVGFRDTGYIRCMLTASWGTEHVQSAPGVYLSPNMVACMTSSQRDADSVGSDFSIALDSQNFKRQLYYRNYKIYLPPAITDFSPQEDYTSGGTVVTISGDQFVDDTYYGRDAKCRFGTVVVNATVLSQYELTCVVPRYPRIETTELWITFNAQNWHECGQFVFLPPARCYTCRDAVAPIGLQEYSDAHHTACVSIWRVLILVIASMCLYNH